MNRVDAAFAALRARGERGLIPFLCGGYPCPGATADAVVRLARPDVPVIEVGVPFSDPVADGPVIAAAMHRCIERGVTPAVVLDEIAAARARVDTAIVVMVSVSIVLRSGGPGAFADACSRAGADGLIVPDAPPEESKEILAAAAARGLTASMLVAPSTPRDRAAAIARASTGFVYLLARAGVTGERAGPPDIAGSVAAIRAASAIPIACGFGISSAEQVREVVRHADAAIVGSALVRAMGAHSTATGAASAAEALVTALVAGLQVGAAWSAATGPTSGSSPAQ